jgi:serine/threonine protein kinase
MDISYKSNKITYPIKLSYEYTDITKLVTSLKIFKSEYKIIKEIHITHTKGVYAVINNSGKKFFMKAKLKNFMSDNDLKIYKLLKKNQHPNVNAIEFIYSTEKFILILAEFLEGADMSVKQFRKLYENNLMDIFEVTLHGLSHLHSLGIIHCDMKMENIMIVPKRDICGIVKYVPIIVDFDCSRLIDDCRVNKCIGTTGCIAPEIATGIVSKKSDLWELGMVFYYYIFGNNNTTDGDSSSSTDEEDKIILPKLELLNGYTGKYRKIINIIKPMLNVNHEYRPEIPNILELFNLESHFFSCNEKKQNSNK